MNKIIPFIIMFSLVCGNASALEVLTSRGIITINNGDSIPTRSMLEGTIIGLENVTFVNWNFSRKQPHTEVFINCKNLKFIDCNLVNVELQEDFVIDGSLILHKRKYEMIGIKYEEIEYKNGKTKTYRIDEELIDAVEEEYPEIKKEHKDKLKLDMPDYTRETKVLISTEDTTNEKKIKVKYVHPNTRAISNLNSVAVIE